MQHGFKKIPLIFSSILFLASCALFLFVYKEIDVNNRVSLESQAKWQSEADRRDEIKSFDRSTKAIEAGRESLETHFAKSSDVVPFLNALELTATMAHVKVQISSVDIPKDNTGLVVGMNASGSFSATYQFLALLENFPYELKIISLNLSKTADLDPATGGAKIPNWQAIFRIKLLSFTP